MTKLGITTLTLLFVAGIALVAAPFALNAQPGGDPWTTATRNDVIVGAALTATASLGFFTTLAGHVSDLYSRAARTRSLQPQAAYLDDPEALTLPIHGH